IVAGRAAGKHGDKILELHIAGRLIAYLGHIGDHAAALALEAPGKGTRLVVELGRGGQHPGAGGLAHLAGVVEGARGGGNPHAGPASDINDCRLAHWRARSSWKRSPTETGSDRAGRAMTETFPVT